MDVDLTQTLDCFDDLDLLKSYDLLVPVWTMGSLSREASQNPPLAVYYGCKLGGASRWGRGETSGEYYV